MIRSLYTLGHHIRQIIGEDPAALVEQLALTTADEEESVGEGPSRTRSLIGILDLYPEKRVLRHYTVEANADSLRRFLWIQLMKFSPGGDKIDVTVRDLRYLLGPVLAGLAPRSLGLNRAASPIRDAVEELLKPILPYVVDVGGKASERFLLNLDGFALDPPAGSFSGSVLRVVDGQLQVEWSELRSAEPKKRLDLLTKELREALGWKREVQYVSLSINGRALAQEPAYRQFVFSILVDEPFGEATKGRCYLCGRAGLVTASFKPMRIKVFINDKVSFAGRLVNDGFFERYSVCRDCYIDLLIADRLLEQELEAQLLRSPVFLVPEFVTQPSGDLQQVRQRLQRVRQEATELGRLASLRRTPEEIARLARERAGAYATLTLLFHEKQNMAVKIREIISEVPPSRVQRLIEAINRVNDASDPGAWGAPFQGSGANGSGWFGGLDDLLDTLPLRLSEARPVVRPALTLARQLLQGEPIDLTSLHEQFLEGARALVSRHSGYWVVPRRWGQTAPRFTEVDRELRRYIARTLALRLIAESMGCIVLGGAEVQSPIPDLYRTVMSGLALGEHEQALFLLGVLVARVAAEQYRAGQTKPILEKLNYTGMSVPRLVAFANELFDKLRQYRLLSGYGSAQNEILYSNAIALLTRYRDRWSLTDAENVYFILSGYSYETARILQHGAERPQSSEAMTSSAVTQV